MSKAENRHYEKVHQKKQHPASKCRKPNCLVCHWAKVMKEPNRKQKQENSKRLNDNE